MKPAQKGHPWGVKHKLVVVFGRRIELDKIRSLFGRSWNGFETTASAGRPHVHPSLPNRGRASLYRVALSMTPLGFRPLLFSR